MSRACQGKAERPAAAKGKPIPDDWGLRATGAAAKRGHGAGCALPALD